MSAFSDILHWKVKGDVQRLVFYVLVLNQYSVSADMRVWVPESASERQKQYLNISSQITSEPLVFMLSNTEIVVKG